MRILFCTDGSRISFNALNNLSGWVNKDAIIDVISVIDWSFLPDEINIENENFTCTCANMADSILDSAYNEIERLGLKPGEKIKACGSAIESILEQINTEEYNLILTGSHGKKGLQKWLGSVSQEIINSSKISNYVAKEVNKNKRVLLTTDGNLCSSAVIHEVIPYMNFENKEIYICMVNEDPNFLFLDGTIDTNWLLEIQNQQQYYASKAIEDIKNILHEYNIKEKETAILNGIPAQKIIDYSRQNDIDLIILGSGNKSGLAKFLSASVSKRVLENVTSDILLVKCNLDD